MTTADRPEPRRRATPAPDEAAGATPIAPRPAPAVTRPAAPVRMTYGQLNVRIESDLLALFDAIKAHDGSSQVDTVRSMIREAAATRNIPTP